MRRRSTRFALAASLAATAAAVAAPGASAEFHLMKIKEITGDNGGQGSYIELQMYAVGQNQVAGHNITIWNATASVLGNPVPIAELPLTGPNPPNGENQRSILIGDTGVTARDFTLDFTPYLDNTSGMNVAGAGAACFEAIPVDCVSWGGTGFSGASNLPDQTQPIGSSLGVGVLSFTRKVTGGSCATALEATDDTNNAANDFVNGPASPTPNSATPTETLCQPGLPPGGGQGTPPPKSKKKKCKKKKKKKGRAAAAARKCKKKKKK